MKTNQNLQDNCTKKKKLRQSMHNKDITQSYMHRMENFSDPKNSSMIDFIKNAEKQINNLSANIENDEALTSFIDKTPQLTLEKNEDENI